MFDRDLKERRVPAMWNSGGELGIARAEALRSLLGVLKEQPEFQCVWHTE